VLSELVSIDHDLPIVGEDVSAGLRVATVRYCGCTRHPLGPCS
jgi:hypothetical protein